MKLILIFDKLDTN